MFEQVYNLLNTPEANAADPMARMLLRTLARESMILSHLEYSASSRDIAPFPFQPGAPPVIDGSSFYSGEEPDRQTGMKADTAARHGARRFRRPEEALGPYEDAVAAHYKRQGIPIEDKSQVFGYEDSSSYGGKLAIQSMVRLHRAEHGDAPDNNVVLVVEPYWEILPIMAAGAGAKLVAVPTAEDGYTLDPARLERVIEEIGASNIAGMIVAIPNNTTLSVYDPERLQGLADVVAKTGIRVFSDELYSGMERPGLSHTAFASLTATDGTPLHGQVFTSGGTTKTLNLQQPKYGYGCCGDAEWMQAVKDRHVVLEAGRKWEPREAREMLRAAYFIENPPTQGLDRNRAAFARKADRMAELLEGSPLEMVPHEAGYMGCLTLPRSLCESYGIRNSEHLCEYLLATTAVATKPIFSEAADTIGVRFNFCDGKAMEDAVGRMVALTKEMELLQDAPEFMRPVHNDEVQRQVDRMINRSPLKQQSNIGRVLG